jgi:hypothetical protein
MPAWEFALRFVNVFLAAIVAGGQLLVLLAIVPVKRQWPQELSLKLHQDMLIVPPDRYLKPSVGAMFATAILILALRRDFTEPSGIFTAVGLASTIGVMITAQFWNFATNRVVRTLSLEPVPAEYAKLAQRWDTAHAVRTGFGVAAFVCYLIAGLAR